MNTSGFTSACPASAPRRLRAGLAAGLAAAAVLALGVAASAMVPAAPAQAAVVSPADPTGRTPLVILRFQQPRIYYDKPLYNAVAQAAQIRRDVVFDLIAYSSAERSGDAQRRLNEVVASMQRMGVPPARITARTVATGNLGYPEIHVLVR